MSGRIRTIKPELLEDAKTAALSDSAFRVFIGMILLADDYGNTRAEVRYLEGQIYWAAIPEGSVKLSCESLETLVTFYTVRGQLYAHINGWDKHQRVQHPGKPRVPGYEQRDCGNPHESLQKVSGEPPESLAPDLRPPTSDHDPEQQAESETLVPATALPPVSPHPDPEVEKVIAAILADPKFQDLSRHDLRDMVPRMMPVGKRMATADYLRSVNEAAADSLIGDMAHTRVKLLRRYLGSTKRERSEDTPNRSAAYREFDIEPSELKRAKAPPRSTTRPIEPPEELLSAEERAARGAKALASFKTGFGSGPKEVATK